MRTRRSSINAWLLYDGIKKATTIICSGSTVQCEVAFLVNKITGEGYRRSLYCNMCSIYSTQTLWKTMPFIKLYYHLLNFFCASYLYVFWGQMNRYCFYNSTNNNWDSAFPNRKCIGNFAQMAFICLKTQFSFW